MTPTPFFPHEHTHIQDSLSKHTVMALRMEGYQEQAIARLLGLNPCRFRRQFAKNTFRLSHDQLRVLRTFLISHAQALAATRTTPQHPSEEYFQSRRAATIQWFYTLAKEIAHEVA